MTTYYNTASSSSNINQNITEIEQSQSSTTLPPLDTTIINEEDGKWLKNLNPNDKKWLDNLRNYLYYRILHIVEPDYELRMQYVAIKPMKVWASSFTHSSYNPNAGENYEVLEKMGDAVMKEKFTWYMMNKFPSIKENHLSSFTDYYLAKSFQADMAVDLGLNNFIRTYTDINKHTKEDALESLFGGLYFISEILINRYKITTGKSGNVDKKDITTDKSYRVISLGSDNCSKLLNHLFKDVKFDANLLKGSDINQVKEIFDKLQWKSGTNVLNEIEHITELQDGRYMYKLKFNRAFYEWLETQNIMAKMNNVAPAHFKQIFGVGVNYDKAEAKRAAYKNGLNILSSYKITRDWADRVQLTHPFWDSELKQLFNYASIEATKSGYNRIKFGKLRKGGTAYYIQLLGVHTNGYIDILTTIDGSSKLGSILGKKTSIKDDDMRKAALIWYINNGVNPNPVPYNVAINTSTNKNIN